MKLNLIGQKFGRWTVVSGAANRIMKDRSITMWLCRCDCGNESCIVAHDLRSGKSKSCGCLRTEWLVKRTTIYPPDTIYSSEYYIWSSMKDRCGNLNNKAYGRYGGRGIKVCERWMSSFENFISDMGEKPSPKSSLDRYPNNDGNYEPSNCRWATPSQQSRGKRNNRYIEHGSVRMILMDWAKLLNVNCNTLSYHLETKTISEVLEYYNKKRMPA